MPSCWSSDVCRSEEHTSELQSLTNLVCRLLLEKKYKYYRFGTGNKITPKITRPNTSIKKNSPVSLFQSSPFFRSIMKFFFKVSGTHGNLPPSPPRPLPT